MSPMISSIFDRLSVTTLVNLARRAKYVLSGVYLPPTFLGETLLLAQLRHKAVCLKTSLSQVKMMQSPQ